MALAKKYASWVNGYGCWLDLDCDSFLDAYLSVDDGGMVYRCDENEVFFRRADKTFNEANEQLRKYSGLKKGVDSWKKSF